MRTLFVKILLNLKCLVAILTTLYFIFCAWFMVVELNYEDENLFFLFYGSLVITFIVTSGSFAYIDNFSITINSSFYKALKEKIEAMPLSDEDKEIYQKALFHCKEEQQSLVFYICEKKLYQGKFCKEALRLFQELVDKKFKAYKREKMKERLEVLKAEQKQRRIEENEKLMERNIQLNIKELI